MNFSPLELGAWSTAVGSVGAGAVLLRMRWSRASTEIQKDRTESKFLDQLVDDARDVREAWKERQRDAAAIAELKTHNDALKRDQARLTMEFEAFKRLVVRLYPESRTFLASTFAPFDDKGS